MPEYQFSKHYTVPEARSLLPKIRDWIDNLLKVRVEWRQLDRTIALMFQKSTDLGGEAVNRRIWVIAAHLELVEKFRSRQILIKDLERKLVDFPHLREGEEVFLCWEEGDSDINYWHSLNEGYAGRKPL